MLRPGAGSADLTAGLRLGPDQREILEIGPVIAGRFQSAERKLRGDVFGGQIAAARADAAAFEQIAGQEFHVRAHALAGDIVHLRPGRRSQKKKQQRAFHAVIITSPDCANAARHGGGADLAGDP